MDTKIQKYAKRCELAGRILILWITTNLVFKWVLDRVTYYLLVQFDHLDTTKYKTLLDVFEKFSSTDLASIRLVDRIFQIDMGLSWMGLKNLAQLSWQAHVIGFLVDGISVALITTGLWLFIKVMRQLTKGSIFSLEVIESLNKIAKIIFWYALYTPINRMIIDILIAFSYPVGQRVWAIDVGFNDIFMLTISWFFVILTSLMRESRELQADRDLTV